jgi:hypothetical protein
MTYTVNDRRGQEKPTEVCRVCGSKDTHSREYNKPTMDCIKYLRAENDSREIIAEMAKLISLMDAIFNSKPILDNIDPDEIGYVIKDYVDVNLRKDMNTWIRVYKEVYKPKENNADAISN